MGYTSLSFCTGFGGLDLGLRRVLPCVRTLAYCEIEAYAVANLVAKMEGGAMDSAPIWSNIKTFPHDPFCGNVDFITGGYPCQPFSHAGKRGGENDPRHLWPFIRTAVERIAPVCCFFENVEGHISLGLSSVLDDLEERGYKTAWGIFSAEEVGANHRRKRVFILAHSDNAGQPAGYRNREERDDVRRCGTGMAYPDCPRLEVGQSGKSKQRATTVGNGWWESEPDVGRMVNGDPVRVDRLRLLGNGVVPEQAEKAFRTLAKELGIYGQV